MSAPLGPQLLAALASGDDEQVRRLLRQLLGDASPAKPYSQVDGERPSGCGRSKYLRVWRLAREAGAAGATCEGRARLLSADAWARWSTRLPSRAKAKPAPNAVMSATDALLAELSARVA